MDASKSPIAERTMLSAYAASAANRAQPASVSVSVRMLGQPPTAVATDPTPSPTDRGAPAEATSPTCGWPYGVASQSMSARPSGQTASNSCGGRSSPASLAFDTTQSASSAGVSGPA